jgi:hypothetical protein
MESVDSKLASEFVESPNHRNGRLYPLTKITIHHAAMVCNARTIANCFVSKNRSASATYCVGNDGSIVQCVKEADMPWTSSNGDNDNRAITIEVANSTRGGQWPVSDSAMESLIKLLVDICQRNPGIGRLNYTGDTSGNMTMHRWFSNTLCPGPYLAGKFPEIAAEVNKRLDSAEAASKVTMKKVYDLTVTGLDKSTADKFAADMNAAGYTPTLIQREIEVKPEKPEGNDSGYTKIMNNAVATIQQMAVYIKAKNPDVAQSVIEMIPYYISEGKTEGVSGDIAFAQSCVETGNFRFPQTTCNVTIDQNNFAMMGVVAADSKGESFVTPQIGIRAQIQHLKAYASSDPLIGELVDPRFKYVARGSAPYVEWLGMKENPQGKGWASSAGYGKKILDVLKAVRETHVEHHTEQPAKDELAVGDLVTMQKGAPVYGQTREFQSWVYNKKLYVRAISGDRITVSIYRTGAITGNVDKKYLTKI